MRRHPLHGQAATTFGAAIAAVTIAIAAAACSHDRGDTAAFCVQFPQRDAGLALRVPADPVFTGDTGLAKNLLAFSAEGVDKHAPEAIAPSVGTYVAALRGYQPGTDPMSDPGVARSVDEINRWLAANCTSQPARTSPPGQSTSPGSR